MNNVIVHSNRATASVKALTHQIEADRRVGIALMRSAVEDLMRLANEPGFDFASELVRKCQRVLFEIETLDPSNPPISEKVQALGRRVQSLRVELLQRMIDPPRTPP